MYNLKYKMKNLVYFGSPEFSAQILESIIKSKSVNVVGVVTTPDKPTGRKQLLTPSPLALLAEHYHLPTYKPAKLDEANLAHLKLLKPDIFLVVSYGKIVPQSWLDTPSLGTFNVHFSLLPKYRGALCISESLKNQDTETGVTLMEMDALLDHGDIIAQQKVTIDINDNVSTLITKLTQAAKEILEHKLPEICAQNYAKTPQDESLATFTPSHRTQTHATAFIPWNTIKNALTSENSKLSSETHALIRSLNPEPGAWTIIPKSPVGVDPRVDPKSTPTEIKILKTSLINSSLRGGNPTVYPGQQAGWQSHSTKLIIETVQMPGKQPISWKQFLSGHPLSR